MKDKSDSSDNSSRKSRKIGEKLRRERLNALIAQLAEENPWSAKSEKRVDKAGILKLTVSYLKFHHGLKKLKISNGKESTYLTSNSVLKCLNETIHGFLLIVSEKENIIFVSSSITKLLGLHQTDVVGAELSKYVHPEDLELFRKQLKERQNVFHTINSSLVRPNGRVYSGFNSSDHQIRSFYVRMLKAAEKNNNEKQYEMIHFNGQLRSNICNGAEETSNGVVDKHWLIAVGRPSTSGIINEVPTLYSKGDEFVTQFDLFGNIWFSDHRVAVVLGKMPSESVGTNCYNTIYKEDIPFVSHSHSLIMKSPMTVTVFRMTVGSKCLYLLSRSIVARDSWTKEPKCIVSLNITLSEDEGIKQLELQRKELAKFLALKDKSDSKEEDNRSEVKSRSDKYSNDREKNEPEKWEDIPCGVTCESLQNVLEDISVNSSFEVKRDLIDSGDDSVSSKLERSVKRLSDSDLEDEHMTSEITVSTENPIQQNDSLSVLKELLLRKEKVSSQEEINDMLNMDMQKSFDNQIYQNFEKFSNDRKFEVCGQEDMFPRMSYKSPRSVTGTVANSMFASGMVNNDHTQNMFHPYHRSTSKPFQSKSKDNVSQNDSSLFHGNQKGCVSPLNSPLTYQRMDSSLQHISPMSQNGIGSMPSSDPSSSMYQVSGYTGASSSQSFLTPSSFPLYNGPMNPLPHSRQNPTYISESGTAQKEYGNYPFYGADSITTEPSMLGCNTGQEDSHFVNSIMTPNSNTGNFDPFSYNNFSSKPVPDYTVISENLPNSYGTDLGFADKKMKCSSLDFAQLGGYSHSPGQDSVSSGKSSSSYTSHVSSDMDTLCATKVQSPTVDSVTSPGTPKLNDEKGLHIQLKLSQQLHTKQNLIGQSLTNQRDELSMLKTQLKDVGGINGQYMDLLQRLSSLEKEVREQDSLLTDLREQSHVKIKQIMSQES